MRKQSRRKNSFECSLFNTVLVATDGSLAAGWAMERVARLPIAKGGKVIVAHVLPEEALPRNRKRMEKEVERKLQGVLRRMEGAYRRTRRTDVSVSTVFRAGAPYREITHLARTEGADLIVLGRHGHRTVRDLLLGSTTEKILHAGELPVLIVTRKPSANYRRATVALDLEDTSRTTFELALCASGPEATDISVIHAYAAPFEGAITHRESDAYRRQCRQEALSRLHEIVDPLTGAEWHAVVRFGDPRTVILREVKARRADLVVLGTHGRSGLSHFLLGSVA
jgi:nucleotide-binding universal stress UspA family protein